MRPGGETDTVVTGSGRRERSTNAHYPGTIENDCNRAHPGVPDTHLYHAKNHRYYPSVSDSVDHRARDQFHWMVNAEAGNRGGRRPAGGSSEEIVIFSWGAKGESKREERRGRGPVRLSSGPLGFSKRIYPRNFSICSFTSAGWSIDTRCPPSGIRVAVTAGISFFTRSIAAVGS